MSKTCRNCFNTHFIELDGYIICSKCGVICRDYTANTSIEIVDFLSIEELKKVDDLLLKEPTLSAEDIKKRLGLIDYLK